MGHPSPQVRPLPRPCAGRRVKHTATFWFTHANTQFYSRKPWPAETGHKPFNLCAHRLSVNASDLSTRGKTLSLQKSLTTCPCLPRCWRTWPGLWLPRASPALRAGTEGLGKGQAVVCTALQSLRVSLYLCSSLVHPTCTWGFYPNHVCLPQVRLQQHPQGQSCPLAPAETQLQTTTTRNGPGSHCRMQKLQLQQEPQSRIISGGECAFYF